METPKSYYFIVECIQQPQWFKCWGLFDIDNDTMTVIIKNSSDTLKSHKYSTYEDYQKAIKFLKNNGYTVYDGE